MAVASAASATVVGRHLDVGEVEALALRKTDGVDAEAEEHVEVCRACRTEVEDLARFAQSIAADPDRTKSAANVAPSRVSQLLQMSKEEQRIAVATITWSLSELQELNKEGMASEKNGSAASLPINQLLSLMCDNADVGISSAILDSVKWQSLYRIVIDGPRCGRLTEAEAALKVADELARNLPNPEHFVARLDIGHLFVHADIASPNICSRGSVDLNRAADIALSFGDSRLYLLTEHYKATYYYVNGRYDLAAESFMAAAKSSIPWHRQAAFYGVSASFVRLGDVGRAEQYLTLAEEERIDPPYASIVPRFVWLHGLIAMGRGKYEEACRLLLEARDRLKPLAGHDAIFLYIDLAEAHVLAGDYTAAIDAAQHATSYFSKLPPSVALTQAISVLQEAFASRRTERICASLNDARGYVLTFRASDRTASTTS